MTKNTIAEGKFIVNKILGSGSGSVNIGRTNIDPNQPDETFENHPDKTSNEPLSTNFFTNLNLA